MLVEEARRTPIAEKANLGEKSRSGFTVEVGFKTAGLAMNTHRGRRPARRYKIPGVRVVKIWAVLTYPIAALSSWFELHGVPAFLSMVFLGGGAACVLILIREKQADQGVGGPTTLNLHR